MNLLLTIQVKDDQSNFELSSQTKAAFNEFIHVQGLHFGLMKASKTNRKSQNTCCSIYFTTIWG